MFISEYEKQYISTLKVLKSDGIRENDTNVLPNFTVHIDLQREFPVLKSKRVDWKSVESAILRRQDKIDASASFLTMYGWRDKDITADYTKIERYLHSIYVIPEIDAYNELPEKIAEFAVLSSLFAKEMFIYPGLLTVVASRIFVNIDDFDKIDDQVIYFEAMKGFMAKPQTESKILRAYVAHKSEYDDIRDFRCRLFSIVESIPYYKALDNKSFSKSPIQEYSLDNYEAFTGDKL